MRYLLFVIVLLGSCTKSSINSVGVKPTSIDFNADTVDYDWHRLHLDSDSKFYYRWNNTDVESGGYWELRKKEEDVK